MQIGSVTGVNSAVAVSLNMWENMNGEAQGFCFANNQ